MSTIEILLAALGGLFTLAVAMAGFWGKDIRQTLREMNSKLSNLDRFEGRVETKLEDYERRLARLEESRGT